MSSILKKHSLFASVMTGVTALSLTGAGCNSTDSDATSAAPPSVPVTNTETPVVEATQPSSEHVVSIGTYKDGTYSADGQYEVHKGSEHIKITVTLKDNVITDSQFEATPAFPMSQRFMDMFSSNYKAAVIGKNINEVHLGKISGSSLTPNGFNNALEKIKAQAKM